MFHVSYEYKGVRTEYRVGPYTRAEAEAVVALFRSRDYRRHGFCKVHLVAKVSGE